MSDEHILEKIESVLEQVRPNLQMDGGDVEFVKYEDGIVYIRLTGACVGCPMSQYTLKLGIEEQLKEQLPEVIEVIALSN